MPKSVKKSVKKEVKKEEPKVIDPDDYTFEEMMNGDHCFKQRTYLIPEEKLYEGYTFRSADKKSQMPEIMKKYPHQW